MRYAIVLAGLLASLPAAAETACFDVVETQRGFFLVNRCDGRTWMLRDDATYGAEWWPLPLNQQPWAPAQAVAPGVFDPNRAGFDWQKLLEEGTTEHQH